MKNKLKHIVNNAVNNISVFADIAINYLSGHDICEEIKIYEGHGTNFQTLSERKDQKYGSNPR